MNLKYKLLWFDDNTEWVKSIEGFVKDAIEELGFIYECEIYRSGTSIDKIQLGNYDIILMDLNLDDDASRNGDQLIDKIRSLDVYTDVLFYSADGLAKIKEKAQALGLEGVYFSGRNQDSFITKLRKVINTTINKVQDLNNLRGLVMAEVSELDSRMTTLINKYFVEKESDEKTDSFKKHLVKDIEKATKKKLTESEKCDKLCKHKWNSLTVNEIIQDFEFDASRKARAVKLIIETEGLSYEAKNGNFFEDYRIEMLNMRNQLAHCISTIKDGKEILIVKDGELEFDGEKFKTIRGQIKSYNAVFDDIEAII